MSIRSRSFSSRTPAFFRIRRSSVMSSFVSAMVPCERDSDHLKPAPGSFRAYRTYRTIKARRTLRGHHGDDAESLGGPVHRLDVRAGRSGLGDSDAPRPGLRAVAA